MGLLAARIGVDRRDLRLPAGYVPRDAEPYCHPTRLDASWVDAAIWPAVERINQSGWVWTLESCQGPPDKWINAPTIRLAVHHGLAGRMLGLLHRSALIGNFDPTVATAQGLPFTPPPQRVEVYRHVHPPIAGWFEARALVHGPGGIGVFERFADAVDRGVK